MTETKPAAFAKGDAVTFEGEKLIVVNQGSPGGAVLCETPKGVKPYGSTFYAADALKKASSRSKSKEKQAEVADYLVTFKVGDDPEFQVAIEGASSEDDAISKAQADDSVIEGSELVSIEKVEA